MSEEKFGLTQAEQLLLENTKLLRDISNLEGELGETRKSLAEGQAKLSESVLVMGIFAKHKMSPGTHRVEVIEGGYKLTPLKPEEPLVEESKES